MTDQTPAFQSIIEVGAQTKKRKRAEKRFRLYGLSAIMIGLLMLFFLLVTILGNGISAFQQATLAVPVTLNQEEVDKAEAALMKTGEYSKIILASFKADLEANGIETNLDDKAIKGMLSKRAASDLREFVLAHPDQIGETHDFEFLANAYIDGYLKGRVTREYVANNKNISSEQLDFADQLIETGKLHKSFNMRFITGSDASDNSPEEAGLGTSMLGSLAMMIVVLALSLPLGVAASIYLEEFAPKNRITDLIEVNISNLAAVPSIVFGILGLSVFINYMHLPQSAPIVGGLVLTFKTLPTIIIATRAALRAVPPSIREAALGVGASKMQTITDHVLPLAMPGILTGTIIGLAQALGESAPLLLIGMVGFIATNPPTTFGEMFMSPNSAMPAQIYEWAKRADPAFYERAWGGIIILLTFLIVMNIVAIILRRRFERRW